MSTVGILSPSPSLSLWGTGPRLVVGVSAFGFGGTNAHAVLTNYPDDESAGAPRAFFAPHAHPNPPLLLSARSPQALRDAARDMAQHLRDREDLTDYDVAYSAAFHRQVNPHGINVNHQ